jgi:hypothetical protein
MLPGILDFLILKLAIDSFTEILSLCTLIVSLALEGSIVEDQPGLELTVVEAAVGEAEERDRPGMELTVLLILEDESDGGCRSLVGTWGRGDRPELCFHVGGTSPSEGEPPGGR